MLLNDFRWRMFNEELKANMSMDKDIVTIRCLLIQRFKVSDEMKKGSSSIIDVHNYGVVVLVFARRFSYWEKERNRETSDRCNFESFQHAKHNAYVFFNNKAFLCLYSIITSFFFFCVKKVLRTSLLKSWWFVHITQCVKILHWKIKTNKQHMI